MKKKITSGQWIFYLTNDLYQTEHFLPEPKSKAVTLIQLLLHHPKPSSPDRTGSFPPENTDNDQLPHTVYRESKLALPIILRVGTQLCPWSPWEGEEGKFHSFQSLCYYPERQGSNQREHPVRQDRGRVWRQAWHPSGLWGWAGELPAANLSLASLLWELQSHKRERRKAIIQPRVPFRVINTKLAPNTDLWAAGMWECEWELGAEVVGLTPLWAVYWRAGLWSLWISYSSEYSVILSQIWPACAARVEGTVPGPSHMQGQPRLLPFPHLHPQAGN